MCEPAQKRSRSSSWLEAIFPAYSQSAWPFQYWANVPIVFEGVARLVGSAVAAREAATTRTVSRIRRTAAGGHGMRNVAFLW